MGKVHKGNPHWVSDAVPISRSFSHDPFKLVVLPIQTAFRFTAALKTAVEFSSISMHFQWEVCSRAVGIHLSFITRQ
jgi:hypothetical protein